MPLDWAETQESLARAVLVLAIRTTGGTRMAYLKGALTAVDRALDVYREGNAPYYVEKAERLRAGILAEQAKAQAP